MCQWRWVTAWKALRCNSGSEENSRPCRDKPVDDPALVEGSPPHREDSVDDITSPDEMKLGRNKDAWKPLFIAASEMRLHGTTVSNEFVELLNGGPRKRLAEFDALRDPGGPSLKVRAKGDNTTFVVPHYILKRIPGYWQVDMHPAILRWCLYFARSGAVPVLQGENCAEAYVDLAEQADSLGMDDLAREARHWSMIKSHGRRKRRSSVASRDSERTVV